MTRTKRLGVSAVVVAVICFGSACAVIPMGGPFPVSEVEGGDPMSKPFQRMVAVAPQPTWTATQVAQGLQSAMAAYADDPGVLPGYLTPEARKTWKPDGPVTVVDNVVPVQKDGHDQQVTVSLTGTRVAQIDDDDTYVPASGAVDSKITLVKDAQGYHVQSLPAGLLLTQADVDRAYRPTNLYYLNGAPGSGGESSDMLVVDRVRLRIKPTENFAKTIVERLIKGPSKALQGAVENVFPAGTRVESVKAADDRVIVNLSGPIDPGDVFSKGLQSQLKWSLNRNEVANGRTIEVQVDGEPFYASESLTIPPTLDESWLDSPSESEYYTTRGAVLAMPLKGAGRPVAGPAGQPNSVYSHFAVSGGDQYVAALSSAGGIWVSPVAADGRWQEWVPGGPHDLTDPSWHRDGTLWTYDRRHGAVLRSDPAIGRGPERVAAPSLDGFDVTRLRVARDGVRVAVTVGKNEIRVGAITGVGPSVMLSNFQTLSSVADEEILDIAWRDGGHLLVLSQSEAGQFVKEINVGDGTTVQLPYDKRLRTFAALDEHILAGTEKGNEILEFNEDKQQWTSKITTAADTPIFPLG
jgi:hypothetical protein